MFMDLVIPYQKESIYLMFSIYPFTKSQQSILLGEPLFFNISYLYDKEAQRSYCETSRVSFVLEEPFERTS